jgi:hypothetical protein
MLVYLLSLVLCGLYASDTLIIAFNYRFHSVNPSSAKLLLLAESLKLAISSGEGGPEARTLWFAARATLT